MGSVTLHPQDALNNHLHNRRYNPNPLISPSNSPTMKSRSNFISKPNPNPRRKNINDMTGTPQKTSGTSGGRRDVLKLPQKTTGTGGGRRDATKSPQKTGMNGGRRDVTKSPQKSKPTQLVMEKVKILKRGETLNDDTALVEQTVSLVKKKDENQVVEKQIYAGSTVSMTSPPPSSVPMPGFFKKGSGALTEINNNADSVTNGLIKLLNLNL